jgi:hypothetical protein
MRNIQNKLLLLGVLFIGLLVFGMGYIPSYPIWVDDFSCMDNDVLSRIIVNGRYKKNKGMMLAGRTGFSMLDSCEMRRLSDSVFVGKHKDVVMNTFNAYGCGCEVVKGKDRKEYLFCKFRRQWKIKNVGKYHEDEDVAFWVKPIVAVTYELKLDKNGYVQLVDGMKIIEIRRRQTINDKPPIIN